MSKAASANPFNIPLPSGGLNLRDPARLLQPNEALALENCYLLTSGVRTRGPFVSDTGLNAGGNTAYSLFVASATGSTTGNLLACALNKIYYQAAFLGAWTDLGVTTASDLCFFHISSGNTFVCDGTSRVLKITPGMVAAAAGFTFPGGGNDANLAQGWNYNGRQYYVLTNSSTYYWSDLAAVTGPLKVVDISSIFELGGTLLFGTNWTINQGNATANFNVFVSNLGEVLIYSGGNPESSDWQLTARVKIPPPQNRRSFYRLGNEIYIVTNLGVIPLTQALQTGSVSNTYYAASDKLGTDVFNGSTTSQIVECDTFPILFVPTTGVIFGLNYQLGSWFRLANVPFLSDMVCWQNKLYICGVDTGTNAVNYLYFKERSSLTDWNGSSAVLKWQTGEIDLGSPLQKQSLTVRPMVKFVQNGGSFLRADMTVAADGVLGQTSSTQLAVGSSPSQIYQLETAPNGTGRWLIFQHQCIKADIINEFVGTDVYVQPGGVY